MPRPVFPVVRLPYDRPDRVARVLDAVRREIAAAGRQPVAMTARVQLAAVREPEKDPQRAATVDAQPGAACGDEAAVDGVHDQTAVDRVTVGVRECTLTPKPRPEIMVTAGGAATRNAFLGDPQNRGPVPANGGSSCCGSGGGPYLIVPPVNITAEISRPPQYA